jgi:hypothetical protein
MWGLLALLHELLPLAAKVSRARNQIGSEKAQRDFPVAPDQYLFVQYSVSLLSSAIRFLHARCNEIVFYLMRNDCYVPLIF